MKTFKASSAFPQMTVEDLELIQSKLIQSELTEEAEAFQGGSGGASVIALPSRSRSGSSSSNRRRGEDTPETGGSRRGGGGK